MIPSAPTLISGSFCPCTFLQSGHMCWSPYQVAPPSGDARKTTRGRTAPASAGAGQAKPTAIQIIVATNRRPWTLPESRSRVAGYVRNEMQRNRACRFIG
jgi:hypothetical protein